MCFIERLLLSALLLVPTTLLADDAGIFADFTTNHGDFTVQLDYEAAPMTVANFVGLAEGSRPWVDPNSGRIKQNVPFYDGLIFHRVISGFMNQGGCPLGTGTGGPGYRFRDEINNGLLHLPYVISMANSGANTNGSQFFITVSQRSNLDGIHTVFGAVVDGQDTIDAINTVDTDENEKPLDPVVIESVTIRRVGAEAEAFSLDQPLLPSVSGIRGTISLNEEDSITNIYFNITEDRPSPTRLTFFESSDLVEWTGIDGLINVYAHGLQWEDLEIVLGPKNGSKRFYNAVRVDYDELLPTSESELANSTLVFNWGDQSLTFNFDETGLEGEGEYFNEGSVTEFTIVEVINNSEVWDGQWIIVSDQFLPFGILGWLDQLESDVFGGRGRLFQHEGPELGFQPIDFGTFTLTLP